jgi:hypothetical protein
LKGSFCDDCAIASTQHRFQDQSSVLLGEKFVSGLDESIQVILANLIQQLTSTHVGPRLVVAQHPLRIAYRSFEVGLWRLAIAPRADSTATAFCSARRYRSGLSLLVLGVDHRQQGER